jgi:hypothetical protein
VREDLAAIVEVEAQPLPSPLDPFKDPAEERGRERPR